MTCTDEHQLSILYQDDHYIAIDKPAGLLVHRSPIDARETRFAVQELRDQIGQRVYPVHRLDKPTSGVLLFALNESALVEGKRQFEENRVDKTYHSIVRGHIQESGSIDRPLRKMIDFGSQSKSEKEQEAQTAYRRLSKSELPLASEPYPTTRYSYVELNPRTGRRHQLRRHLAGINCPIIGDTKHGDSKRNLAFRERYGFVRLFLHASRLAIHLPQSGKAIEMEAPLPPDFERALIETELKEPDAP